VRQAGGRIDELRKEHRRNGADASDGSSAARPTVEATLPRVAPDSTDTQTEAKSVVALVMKIEPTPHETDARNMEVIARVQ
jgi:hypothetical protein